MLYVKGYLQTCCNKEMVESTDMLIGWPPYPIIAVRPYRTAGTVLDAVQIDWFISQSSFHEEGAPVATQTILSLFWWTSARVLRHYSSLRV